MSWGIRLIYDPARLAAPSATGRPSTASGTGLALLTGFYYAVDATIVSYLITGGADDRAVIDALFGGAAALLTPVAGPEIVAGLVILA